MTNDTTQIVVKFHQAELARVRAERDLRQDNVDALMDEIHDLEQVMDIHRSALRLYGADPDDSVDKSSDPQLPLPGSGGDDKHSNGLAEALRNAGLRDAIRIVLGSQKKAMRPAQVTQVLRDANYSPGGGKTELSLRISNEMSRMKRSGMLTKRGRAGYRLDPKKISLEDLLR